MGRKYIAKGAHILLGPCINMQRSPLGGRGFESISEDPVLAGLAASAMIKGIEKNGIASCLKHFVCNDQKHQRTLYNAIVTDRALREIYLKPFQIATRDSKPSTYMTAYNKINKIHASENQKTLNEILRDKWGWEGMIMSDWFGTYSTSEALIAGLDLEMPGPTRWRAVRDTHALSSGKVSQQTVDERARALLRLVNRCVESKIPENATEDKLDTPETADLLRKIAGESIVLMKNDKGILPLKKNKSTVLIDPNAQTAVYCGGKSSSLSPYYAISPWQAVKSRLDKNTSLNFAIGTYSHKKLPLLGSRLNTAEGR
jgi:beta-glucosidase